MSLYIIVLVTLYCVIARSDNGHKAIISQTKATWEGKWLEWGDPPALAASASHLVFTRPGPGQSVCRFSQREQVDFNTPG